MTFSVYDLLEFHNTNLGRVVVPVISRHVRNFWPDLHNLRVVGIGFTGPYLAPFCAEADRLVALMTSTLGAYPWPEGDKNRVALVDESELPLETNSVDRLILIHGLEHTHHPGVLFEEIWRVLKSNGRLIIIVPNRLGLWARVDRTPFGQGRPYSVAQIARLLRDHRFLHERTRQGLFMLPVGARLALKIAPFLEKYGRFVFPALSGVHMVEASKQLYAATAVPVAEVRRVRGRLTPVLLPNPAVKRDD